MGSDTKLAQNLKSLLEVGKALSAEKNLTRLLSLILDEVTRVTEADRSSILLVDRERNELWSKVAQGLEIREIRVPLTAGIAGHVACTGQVVNIADAYADPRFNPEIDKRTGYVTKTILCAPMINQQGDVIGIIQVLNKRAGCFTRDDEELLLAFCGQAAVAVENTILYEEIQRLFDGFVRASVYAIESRDATTSGHSERVALLTLGLAETVNRTEHGALRDVHFSEPMLKELRYAALLHDFGKVGVREQVLVKANKLYEPSLQLLISRFKFIKRTLEAEHLRRKLELVMSVQAGEVDARLKDLDRRYVEETKKLDEDLRVILELTHPAILPNAGFERLQQIARQYYIDMDGGTQPFLTSEEVSDLSISKGSLNATERLEIESHVTHTIRFLENIPWTKDLKNLPAIAAGHHEKLDGSGYPGKLTADKISLQSRMMTIADIYDALTSADRPYKRAVPVEHALNILSLEAKDGKIDSDLFTLFVQAKIFENLSSPRPGQ